MGVNPGKERLTTDDRATVSRAVRAIAEVSEEALQQLMRLLRVDDLSEGQHLLREGDDAVRVAWVLEGLLREYYLLPDGRERTKAFVEAGGLSGSAADLLRGSSRAYIVAQAPSRIASLHVEELRTLCAASEEWARFRQRALERVLLVKADREYELLALDAEARYRRFSEVYPGLEARVSARHIASYLGITPVHLSRLRGRRAKGRATPRDP